LKLLIRVNRHQGKRAKKALKLVSDIAVKVDDTDQTRDGAETQLLIERPSDE